MIDATAALTAQERVCPLCGQASVTPYRRFERTYLGSHYILDLGRCAACGFVRLLNDPNITYDEDYIAHELVITVESSLVGFKAEERMASVARIVPPKLDKSFLDIGIGDGLLLSLAERYGYRTFGLDVSSATVALAREKFGLRADISLQAMGEAFNGILFDVINGSEVIEHVREPMALLVWCRRHLKPNGCLIVQTGNIDSLVSRLAGAHWEYLRPMHVSYFSASTLQSALRRAGFNIMRCSTVDWRARASLHMAWRLMRKHGLTQAADFLFLYVTTLAVGIRRQVIVYGQ